MAEEMKVQVLLRLPVSVAERVGTSAERVARLILCCGPGNVSTPRLQAGWQERKERMQARYRQVDASASPLPKGVPPVRSPGEKERFAAAYHPYGPVGEAMHLDFPALTFLYAEIMASAGGPPTPSTFPVFATRPVTEEEAAKLQFPVLVIGGTPEANLPMDLFGVFLQDDWRVTDRLTLNLGVRWDYTDGMPIVLSVWPGPAGAPGEDHPHPPRVLRVPRGQDQLRRIA
mgnify:CR=1 FL=1